jgi:hypothetical protein
MAYFYWSLLRKALASLIVSTGRVHTAVGLILFLVTAFNRAVASYIVKTWSGISPWYSVGVILLFLLYEVARVNHEMFRNLGGTRRTVEVEGLIPPGPKIPMKDGDFDREVGVSLGTVYEIIKPSPQDVFKYERRGFERIFIEHQGLSCQVIIGRSADYPEIVPLRRKKITEAARKLIRTAYVRSARSDIGYCFVYDALVENPTVSLDDGTELVGYYAVEAVKELYANQLAVSSPDRKQPSLAHRTRQGMGAGHNGARVVRRCEDVGLPSEFSSPATF